MKNIVSITSAKPDVFTTLAASQIARRIAIDHPEKKVLLLSISDEPELLEKIIDYRAEVFGGSFEDCFKDITNFAFCCLPKPFFKSGTTPDFAEQEAKNLSNEYDIVICDAVGGIENASALGFLFASEYTYFVFDHTAESIKRYIWLNPLLDKLGIHVKGEILDHSAGRPEYGYGEYANALGPNTKADPYIIDDDRNLDEIDILAKSISLDQFGHDISGSFEDRGNR